MPASNVNWPTPLTRWPTLFPGQFGVPGTDSTRGLRQDSNGAIFWVDPNHVDANDQRDGTNPDAPFATVAAALTHCRAYSGDVIAVMHNGAWTYADTTENRTLPIQESVVVTVPGIRIVGISSSPLGATWVPTADNTTCITIRELDVIIEGFNFYSAAYTGATGVLAQWSGGATAYYGDNPIIRHCNFHGLAYGVSLDYAWYSFVEDCRFESIVTAAIFNPSVYGEPDYSFFRDNIFVQCAAGINLPACDYEVIEHNEFMNCTDAIFIDGDHNKIHSNTIEGAPAGAGNFIDIGTDTSSLVSDNWLSCTLAQYAVTCVGGAGGPWVRNHCIDGETVADP